MLTLGILTLLTLLLIAFATSMRVENMASKNFNDLIKARQLAQGAVDDAIAAIRDATPVRNPSLKTYVTFPGVAYVYDGTTTTPKPLYSQAPPSDTFDLNDAMKNIFWITGNSGEFGLPAKAMINVGWIYVAEDGTTGTPPFTPVTPLVGRFAYWVDDEASKININTAGVTATPPTPDLGYSVPSEVDLSASASAFPSNNLTAAAANNIVINRTGTFPPYATAEEVMRADPAINSGVFDANRFSLTAYSVDDSDVNDDHNAFGQSRFILSALNSGDIDGTGGGGVSNAYVLLSNYALSLSSGTFLAKYGANGLKQIIANIIAYQQDPTTTPPQDSGGFLGLAKVPYINEVRVKYEINSPTPPDTTFTMTRTVSLELYYMYDGTYVPGTEQITISGLPSVLGLPTTVTITPPATSFNSGEYREIDAAPDAPVDLKVPTPVQGTAPQVTYSRQYGVGYSRLDFAQISQLSRVILSSVNSAGPVYQGSEVDDSALNEKSASWHSYGNSTAGTLGSKNSVYTYSEYPASKAVMRAQPMKSIGELGFIHRPDLPWKYLTLQPGGGSSSVGQIPDWAMLDVFTVGPTTAPVIPNLTAGRININSFINPGLAAPSPITQRLVPLKALLNSLSVSLPATAPQDVYNYARTDTFGMKDPVTGAPIFDTIGEVCEIPSLATGANEAVKEAAIRRIANLITVRSNTFTIWAIAQSIKEPPNATGQTIGTYQDGIDIITGEVKVQAVVERYEQGGVVKFRTKYFRYWYQ